MIDHWKFFRKFINFKQPKASAILAIVHLIFLARQEVRKVTNFFKPKQSIAPSMMWIRCQATSYKDLLETKHPGSTGNGIDHKNTK